MSTNGSGSSFRFSIRSVLIVMAFVGMILGWWLQYSQLSQSLANEQRRRQEINTVANNYLLEQLRDQSAIGRRVSEFPIECLAAETFDKASWDQVIDNCYDLHGNDDKLKVKEASPSEKYVGYYFPKGDDFEGSPWAYFVLTRNDKILVVACSRGTLD